MKKQALAAFVVGFIFAAGLAISGMTQPQKVIGFLDLRNWDPSLIFVMLGAIAVHASFRPFIMKRQTPVLDSQFHLPTKNKINKSLLIGALFFGLGWGLSGYCPGPALTSIATGDLKVFIFIIAMIAGMLLNLLLNKAKSEVPSPKI